MLVITLLVATMAAQDDPMPRSISVTVQGLRVDLKRCEKLSTKSINCSFVVTNQQADRVVRLNAKHGPSYYVDAGGIQVSAIRSQIGSGAGVSYAVTEAVTDTPVKGSVEFGVGEPHATSLAKLSLSFLSNKQGFRVEFRKVPLEGR